MINAREAANLVKTYESDKSNELVRNFEIDEQIENLATSGNTSLFIALMGQAAIPEFRKNILDAITQKYVPLGFEVFINEKGMYSENEQIEISWKRACDSLAEENDCEGGE